MTRATAGICLGASKKRTTPAPAVFIALVQEVSKRGSPRTGQLVADMLASWAFILGGMTGPG